MDAQITDESVLDSLEALRVRGPASIALPIWYRSRGYDMRRILDTVLRQTLAARPLTAGDIRALRCIVDTDPSVGGEVAAALVTVPAEHVHPAAVVALTACRWASTVVAQWGQHPAHASNVAFVGRVFAAVAHRKGR